MEKVFTRKKGEKTDGCEDYYDFMENFMLKKSAKEDKGLLRYKENFKITIKIEQVK